MPDQSCEDIALRSTNPISRATDVFCLLLLQVLMLMVASADPDPNTLLSHPAFSRYSILSRFDAGETFDLPPLLIASIRIAIRAIRSKLRTRSAAAGEPGARRHVVHPNTAWRVKAARRRIRARHAAQAAQRIASHARPSAPQLRRATITGLFERKAQPFQGLSTSISLRYRNERSHSEACRLSAT